MIRKLTPSIAAALVLASALLGCAPGKWLPVLWWPPAQVSTCLSNLGKLHIHHEQQVGSNWCWVATVSEVLNWYPLRNSAQCQLYDLVEGTTTCQKLSTDPMWRPIPGSNDNLTGHAERAAATYRDIYGRITVNVRGPSVGPLSFSQITEKICPSDGSLGTPYIWVFDNGIDPNTGKSTAHDVVVMGYEYLKPLVALHADTKLHRPADEFANRAEITHADTQLHRPADEFANRVEIVYVHDPANPLNPDFYLYDAYEYFWAKEVMISNISIVLPEFRSRN